MQVGNRPGYLFAHLPELAGAIRRPLPHHFSPTFSPGNFLGVLFLPGPGYQLPICRSDYSNGGSAGLFEPVFPPHFPVGRLLLQT